MITERVHIEITTTDNAAFGDDRDAELVRILRQLADEIESGWVRHGKTVYDANGAPCGAVKVFEE